MYFAIDPLAVRGGVRHAHETETKVNTYGV
jgi:hypothetical protein